MEIVNWILQVEFNSVDFDSFRFISDLSRQSSTHKSHRSFNKFILISISEVSIRTLLKFILFYLIIFPLLVIIVKGLI